MAYSNEEREQILNKIYRNISLGESLAKSCKKQNIHISTFYDWGANKTEDYARACDERCTVIFEEALEIADDINGEVQRDKLRVDTRKWFLSKMLPSKYGDKQQIDHTTGGDKFEPPIIKFK